MCLSNPSFASAKAIDNDQCPLYTVDTYAPFDVRSLFRSGSTNMSGIFISYRRDDTAGHAGRLEDGLKERFPPEQVFMDVDGIEPGMDFVAALEDKVASCD